MRLQSARVTVQASEGLHARPAATFVQEAMKHRSSVVVEANGKTADGKSILQILCLQVKQGQEVLIRADGEDESNAVLDLVTMLGGPRRGSVS